MQLVVEHSHSLHLNPMCCVESLFLQEDEDNLNAATF